MAMITVVNDNDCQLRYRLALVPGWTNHLQLGHLPARSTCIFEAPAPVGARDRFEFTYCKERGRFVNGAHRLWSQWVAPRLRSSVQSIPFGNPGFGSQMIMIAETNTLNNRVESDAAPELRPGSRAGTPHAAPVRKPSETMNPKHESDAPADGDGR